MTNGEIKFINVSLIDSPGHDARIGVDEEALQDLYESIRENGILQPLLVRPREGRFEVIAGGRRLLVARKLGLKTAPCVVRDATDSETAIFRFEENLKRADINPVEEAKYISEAITALGIEIDAFAQSINRSVDWVENRLAIAYMPPYLQQYIIGKKVALGVALA